MKAPKKFELDWDSEKWGWVQSAEWSSRLDSIGTLRLDCVLTPLQRKQFPFKQVPDQVHFKARGRALFSGALACVQATERGVSFEYRDSVETLRKTYESEFLKGQTLEAFCRKLAGIAGKRPRFYGDFQAVLPGQDLAGASYLSHLERASFDYGFSFVELSAAGEIAFIRSGSHRESVSWQPKTLFGLKSSRSAFQIFTEAEVLSFDSNQGVSEKAAFSLGQLYEPVSAYRDTGSFRARKEWTLAKGRKEVVSPEGRTKEWTKAALLSSLGKTAMGSETLSLSVQETRLHPGDKVDLTLDTEELLSGIYQVIEIKLQMASSEPRFIVELGRL
jgi:hypothetical protein